MSTPESSDPAASSEHGWRAGRGAIVNRRALHARAAAQFVKLAQRFAAEVEVVAKGQRVSGSSIMGLMMLAAATGTEIEIRTRGRDAATALEALLGLVAAGFDEELPADSPEGS